MELKIDGSVRTKEVRGLKRFRIDCYAEWKRGKVTQRHIRKDDDGKPFVDKTVALEFMAKLQKRIDAGADAKNEETFSTAFAAWAKQQRADAKNDGIDSRTVEKKIALGKNHILMKWTLRGVEIGDVKLSAIDFGLLHQEIINDGQLMALTYTKRGIEKPISRRLKRDILAMFKSIFEFVSGNPKTWIPNNPAKRLEMPRDRSQKTERALDPKIYRRLSDNCPRILAAIRVIRPDLELPFRLMRLTGLRPQELRALTLDDIENDDGVFELKIAKAIKAETNDLGPTKNRETRYVPVDDSIVAELEARAKNEGAKPHQFIFGDLDQSASGALIRKPLNHASLILVFEQAQLAVFGYRWTTANTSGRNSRLTALEKPIEHHTHDEWCALEFEFTRGRVIDLDPDVIAARRAELGLTAKALAAELGISDRTWGFVDRGARGAKREVAEHAAEILGVDLETLAVNPVPEKVEVQEFGAVADVAQALGVEMFTPYCFRHLYASTLFDRDHSLREIAELLGDREDTTRKFYIHFMKRDRSKSRAILDSINLVTAIPAPRLVVAN